MGVSALSSLFEIVRPKIDAERAVIGAILVSPDEIMPEAEQLLTEDDFLVPEYRTLYRTCSGYFVDGKAIDPVTLIAQHGDEYKPLLAQAIQAMPSVKNWRSYAAIVRDTALRSRAHTGLLELSELLTGAADIGECRESAVRVSESLNNTAQSAAITPLQGLARFIQNAQRPREYFRTGFEKLDSYAYISKGDYIVVGGRPSTGKTALTLQMFLHLAAHHKVVYFSLETSGEKLFDRLAAHYFEIPLPSIKAGELGAWGRLPERSNAFEELRFHVVEAAGWSVSQIQAKAVQLGAEIIFIDYLGLIKSEGNGRYEKITNISVDLHTMAQSRKITVIALSQLNREGAGEPTMEHLRESGQIEQDADVILLLHNLGEQENRDRKLIVAKNKEGVTGAIRLAFDGEKQRFTAVETGRDYA